LKLFFSAQEAFAMRYVGRMIVWMICAALLMTSCKGSDNKPTNVLPAAGPLLDESANQIQDASSLDVEIDVTGYPVELGTTALDTVPADTPLYFKYAKGVFEAPDRLEATIEFSLGVFSTTATLIALDRDHYLRSDLLTANHWINAEIIPGFSPASLMARPGGIASALESVNNLEMVGQEDMDGLEVFHLRGTVQASAFYSLTFGLIRTQTGEINIEVYITVSDRRVALIKLYEPPPADVTDSEDTTWAINFLDYNRDVTITPPPLNED
jgi:hypothetical protein